MHSGVVRPDLTTDIYNRLIEEFNRLLRILDQALGGKNFLVGDTLTIADLAIAATLLNAESAKLPIREYASVQDWRRRIGEIPEWSQQCPNLEVSIEVT